MSDILKTLVQGYYDNIGTLMATGQTFEYIQERHILHPQDTLFLDWSLSAPFILIYPEDFPVSPDSMTARSNTKNYLITLSAFVEFSDETLGFLGNSTMGLKGTYDIYADLDTTYDRNTLSDTSLECLLTRVSFRRIAVPPLVDFHQCHLTFEHLWIDRR
jgi:hypothetical protein